MSVYRPIGPTLVFICFVLAIFDLVHHLEAIIHFPELLRLEILSKI